MKTSLLLALALSLAPTLALALADGTIQGHVSWDAKVKKADRKLQPTAVLYVFARPVGQPKGMPSAVKRIPMPIEFPAAFSLSATDAMMPGTPFVGPFDVTARLSQSGSVMPVQAGDSQGVAQNVKVGVTGVEIQIH